MTYIKKYGNRLLFTTISILLSLLAITLLYYFNIIGQNTNKVLKIIAILINIFISSFILGKNTIKKGYLEGIKLALIIIPIFIIISLLTSSKIEIKAILYYMIILITSILGSMIGINKRKESCLFLFFLCYFNRIINTFTYSRVLIRKLSFHTFCRI